MSYARAVICCAAAIAGLATAQLLAWSAEPEAKVEAQSAQARRHFETQVAPVISKHCLECHDAASKQGGLDLSKKGVAMAGGNSGAAIVPEKSAESLLWDYVDADAMPPENRPKLSDEEKQALKAWIDGGAVWSADEIDPSAHLRDQRAADVWLRRLTVPEYVETVRSAVGVDIEDHARRLLPADVRADGFSNTAYNLNVDLNLVEAYARLAEIVISRIDLQAFLEEHASCRSLDDNCLRKVVAGIGKHLFRGPLKPHETELFLQLAQAVVKEGGDFEEAARYAIEAMLQSPRFVYLIEDQTGDGADRPVNDYELASRISYIIWGGPPDRELMRAADAGELSRTETIAVQAKRMLQDPRAAKRSEQFIHDWLNLGQLNNLRPNPDRFPAWNERLAADMRNETLAYFREIAWEQNRPLSDLMNAQTTFATAGLAHHYGLDWIAKLDERRHREKETIPDRITDGLQLLYTFDQGSGEVVRDVSNAGDPIDLTIEDASAVRWGDDGLTVKNATLIASKDPPARLLEAVRESGAVTIEAWVTPENEKQSGPARIVTFSQDASVRNFTLGQDADKFEMRFRTTVTSANGQPSVFSASKAAKPAPVHILYARDSQGAAAMYVNGRPSGRLQTAGDLSIWNGRFRLALANELTKDRPWKGTLHLVAVYDRALSPTEARRNFAAGAGKPGTGVLAGSPVDPDEDLVALYTFREASGAVVRDVSNAGEPLDMTIAEESAVQWTPHGLRVTSPTLIATAGPPKRLIETLKKTKAVTLEAWVTPANAAQSGPARILTLSAGSSQRNFTLGQEADAFAVRFRTSDRQTDANGLPGLLSLQDAVAPRLTHLAYVRDAEGLTRLFVDGREHAVDNVKGDLSNWDSGHRLALANETTKDRPWLGTYHQAAIYSRALTAEEIQSRVLTSDRYDLTDVPPRGGLLTQGSVLTVGGDEASMVARGLFVLHDVLYSAVGNPPPCADTTPVPTKPGQSQRTVAQARIADGNCGGCHSKFEPLAFGLEKFNGIGAYHDVDEHGNQLRDDGEVLFPGESEPVSYDNSQELMKLLAESERVRMNFTRKVTQFAIGRPLVEADGPVIEEIDRNAQNAGGTYASLIAAVVQSDLVRKIRTETASVKP